MRRPWQAGHRHLTDRHEALTLGKRSTAMLENGRIPVTLAGVFRSDFIERRSFMPIRTILLIVAVILFLLEALGSRMRFRAPFGMLGAGLACFAAAFLF
ncbi:MAG: hypothetical protein E6J00_01325 [Chloroflexi bacterium]|nr:MAG: hypothetical protein E6J00_01325 [Chloroflexota bacterium]